MTDEFVGASKRVAERLGEARNILSEAEQIFSEETTSEHREKWPNFYRLESATRYAQRVLALADPRITRKAIADELVAAAMKTRDTAKEAVSTGGGSLIDAAETLLAAVSATAPTPLSPEEADSAVARLDEVKSEIEGKQREIDELIKGHDAQFGDAIAKRTERFDEDLQKIDADLDSARTGFDQRAQEARDHIAELEDEIAQTAAGLGSRAVAIDNEEESREQTRFALFWSIATIAFAVAAAGVPLVLGVEDSRQTIEAVLGKIAVGLILAGAATYSAGVARHHRQRAATASRLAIELNAFGPFIAPLEKADRDDLRSTIVWRFFGPPEAVKQEVDGAPEPGPGIIEALRLRRKKRTDLLAGEEDSDLGAA